MVILGGCVFLMSEVPLYRYLQPQDALFFDAPTAAPSPESITRSRKVQSANCEASGQLGQDKPASG